MIFSGCFSSRRTRQLQRTMKSEDYIKMLDVNLQLSAQNLD